jgi:DNA-binding MarR family transcriptional regulator
MGRMGKVNTSMSQPMKTEVTEDIARQSLDIIPRLNRWAQSAMLQERIAGELSLRQLSALYVIEHESTTPGQLARRLMVTPAVVTGLIDRLERRGYVRRVSEPGDRRRIHLELTETGREAGSSVRAELTELFQCGLVRLDEDQLETLHRGLVLLDGVIGDLEAKGFTPAKH